jgi:ABC-type ATPase with predicted acetyltransferase domain
MALAFSLRFDEKTEPPRASTRAIALPSPGEILFLAGASGSGKSSLLRVLSRRARRSRAVLNLRSIRLPDRPVIDLFEDDNFPATLRRLSAVGLAEVWTWLRHPRELSEGQRWRLRLALALARAERFGTHSVLVCDEFGAVLDRVSASIVAACVRRAVDARSSTLSAILATSHDDLHAALDPELRIDCDFGQHQLTRRKRGAR